jgi:hypothetical protein
VNTTVLLADSAQAVNGKLYILGGGWTDTQLAPEGLTPPHALAGLVQVPWDKTNQPHQLKATLIDADGQGVEVTDGQAVQFVYDFEVGRPPGVHPGVSIPFPFATNIGPLPLQPGRYRWDLCVDGDEPDRTDVGFTVRAPQSIPLPG